MHERGACGDGGRNSIIDGLQYIDLGIYLISHFDSENETSMYTLLAEDGSWVSEFEYEELVPMSIGVLGIYDKEKT